MKSHILAALAFPPVLALGLSSCAGEGSPSSPVGPRVTGVGVKPNILFLTIGGLPGMHTGSVAAEIAPPDAADKTVEWSSSSPAVTVQPAPGDGLAATVTAAAAPTGTVLITATARDGGHTGTCMVVVAAASVPADGVAVSPETLTLPVGGHGELRAAVSPAGAADKEVAWASSDETVATVDGAADGWATVAAVSAGAARITATTRDGGFEAACAVTVAPTSAADVYVAGYEYSAGADTVAALWKNGGPPADLAASDSEARSVFVTAAGDVYVAGLDYASGTYVATLWKNDDPPVHLASARSTAFSVFVAPDGGVYVAGFETIGGYRTATLWKDGGVHARLGAGETESYANSVFVAAGDVYVVGYEYVKTVPADLATLWKNIDPPVRLSGRWSEAHSVFASASGDFCAVGYEYDGAEDVATLWKNNAPAVRLGLGASRSCAYSVFVSGGDVYAAGEENADGWNTATLWKNSGPPVRLGAGQANSYAYSVHVSGAGEVYVAGEDYSGAGASPATLWRDGVPTRLGATVSSAYASSVFVR